MKKNLHFILLIVLFISLLYTILLCVGDVTTFEGYNNKVTDVENKVLAFIGIFIMLAPLKAASLNYMLTKGKKKKQIEKIFSKLVIINTLCILFSIIGIILFATSVIESITLLGINLSTELTPLSIISIILAVINMLIITASLVAIKLEK